MNGRFQAAPTKSFLRQLKKLPSSVRTRIERAVQEVVSNPYGGVRLRGKLEGLVRWRVGDYRIIYAIDEPKRMVVLIDVGARKTIYG